jgi:hypothetical protein
LVNKKQPLFFHRVAAPANFVDVAIHFVHHRRFNGDRFAQYQKSISFGWFLMFLMV